MSTWRNALGSLWRIEPQDRLKTFFLGLSFFCIIFSYTLIKELKDSVFMALMGTEQYVPIAKLLTIVGLIPMVFLYSKLVDTMRRYQLLCVCAGTYALIGLVCTYFMGHATIGIGSADVGTHRYFGWFFYFFVESFSPFVLSVFWSFLNSISNPQFAKKNYGILVSSSKFGGMLSAGIGWLFLHHAASWKVWGMTDALMIQLLLLISFTALLMVPLIIYGMMRTVSGAQLHGYEAAYQFEKEQSKAGKEQTGIWSGLVMFFKYPYTFGIFSLVLFYETISSVLSYQRLGIAQDIGNGQIAGTSCFLFKLAFSVHVVGFIISLFVTRTLVAKLGERLSLVAVPVLMGLSLFYFMFVNSAHALIMAFVFIRAVYYAFNQPITEALYIPTVKDVKFKSKSWIDTFGKKMSKGVASGVNLIAAQCGRQWAQVMCSGLFSVIVGAWIVVAYLLGKRYDRAIRNQEVIGASEGDE